MSIVMNPEGYDCSQYSSEQNNRSCFICTILSMGLLLNTKDNTGPYSISIISGPVYIHVKRLEWMMQPEVAFFTLVLSCGTAFCESYLSFLKLWWCVFVFLVFMMDVLCFFVFCLSSNTLGPKRVFTFTNLRILVFSVSDNLYINSVNQLEQ